MRRDEFSISEEKETLCTFGRKYTRTFIYTELVTVTLRCSVLELWSRRHSVKWARRFDQNIQKLKMLGTQNCVF